VRWPSGAHASRSGAPDALVSPGDVVEFVRIGGGEQVFVAANLGEGRRGGAAPGDWRVAGAGLA
jgi:hypothetical protein